MIVFSPREAKGDAGRAGELASALKLSSRVAELLCNRGYDTLERAAAFLRPDLSALHDPYLFSQMQDAVDCILATGSMGLGICVFGDYDCDGVCATAILTRFLRSMDFEVIPYIPVRCEEGYGLNKEAIDKLAEQGVELLITVDCGISAAEEIAYAYEKGMEVVVTDHHQCPPVLPECEAIIDPTMEDGYPFSFLCGAGVAFKLVQAIGGLEAALQYVDIAAIATVADIVELTDENRVIVSEGLKRLRAGRADLGALALIEEAGVDRASLEASHIAFGLAPRINAAGRTGCAQESLFLFLTDDEKEAQSLARKLGKENQNRQQIEREIYAEAEAKILAGEADPAHEQALLLTGEDWNSGVIGIVASRLAKRYHRPVILFAGNGDCWTASGRSVEGVHLFDSLSRFSDFFERFGGHAMAAGLTLCKDKYEAFKAAFLDYASNIPSEHMLPQAHYDIQLNYGDIDDQLVEELNRLAPFGTGNPPPVLYLSGVHPESPRTMGQEGQHLRFQLGTLGCVAFGIGDAAVAFDNDELDLLVEVEHNTYAGKTRLQARVREWRSRIPEDIFGYVASREDEFSQAILGRVLKEPMGETLVAPSPEKWTRLEADALKERLANVLAGGIQGTAVLAFSAQGAVDALTFLKERGLIERVDLRWGGLVDPVAYNCLLCAPDLACCDFSGMDRVFCWDGPFDGRVVRALEGKGIELIHGRPEDVNGGDWLRSLYLPREKLIPIYKAMLFLARKRQNFPDRATYEKTLEEQLSISSYESRLALAMFSELEFLKVEDRIPFVVAANDKPAQRDLEESNVYLAVQRLHGDYLAGASRN